MAECRKPITRAAPGDYVLHVTADGNSTVHGDRSIGAALVEVWSSDLQVARPFTVRVGEDHIIQIFADSRFERPFAAVNSGA